MLHENYFMRKIEKYPMCLIVFCAEYVANSSKCLCRRKHLKYGEESFARMTGLTLVCTLVESRELECLHSWQRPLLCLSHPSTDTNIVRYELNMVQCWGLWVLGVRMKKEKKSPDKLTVCLLFVYYWLELNATRELNMYFWSKDKRQTAQQH